VEHLFLVDELHFEIRIIILVNIFEIWDIINGENMVRETGGVRCKDCEYAKVKIPVKNDELVLDPHSSLLEKEKKEWYVYCSKEVWLCLDGQTQKKYFTLDSINSNSGLIRSFSRGCEHFEEAYLSEEMLVIERNNFLSRKRTKKVVKEDLVTVSK